MRKGNAAEFGRRAGGGARRGSEKAPWPFAAARAAPLYF